MADRREKLSMKAALRKYERSKTDKREDLKGARHLLKEEKKAVKRKNGKRK